MRAVVLRPPTASYAASLHSFYTALLHSFSAQHELTRSQPDPSTTQGGAILATFGCWDEHYDSTVACSGFGTTEVKEEAAAAAAAGAAVSTEAALALSYSCYSDSSTKVRVKGVVTLRARACVCVKRKGLFVCYFVFVYHCAIRRHP